MFYKKEHLYYQTLDWKTYIKNCFHRNKNNFLQAVRKDMGTNDIFLMSSGRMGISLSLCVANINRHDEVFVPQFMSKCVLSAVDTGFPSLEFTEKTKAVLLYHLWGFPQNFPEIQKILKNRNILVIEDCAHGVWGKSYGIRLGGFGDTALFSLPKIFEITYAGALRVNNKNYLDAIRKRLDYKISLKEYWESLRGEWTYVNFYRKTTVKRNLSDSQINLQKWYATLLTYPACKGISGKLPQNYEELKEVFRKQNSNFLFLLKNLKNKSFLLDGDEFDEMAPLCYPFLSEDESVLFKVDSWLKETGIYTGIYHFDINRNMFNPNFKKCVPIPIYASIDKSLLESFVRKFSEVG
jgi:hypothetical protein